MKQGHRKEQRNRKTTIKEVLQNIFLQKWLQWYVLAHMVPRRLPFLNHDTQPNTSSLFLLNLAGLVSSLQPISNEIKITLCFLRLDIKEQILFLLCLLGNHTSRLQRPKAATL